MGWEEAIWNHPGEWGRPHHGVCGPAAGSFGGQRQVSHRSWAGEHQPWPPGRLCRHGCEAAVSCSCPPRLASSGLEKRVTGAIISTWHSKPCRSLKGTAGPGSATLFIRQLISRLSAEATRAGPGREAVLSTIQSSPTNITEPVLCTREAL